MQTLKRSTSFMQNPDPNLRNHREMQGGVLNQSKEAHAEGGECHSIAAHNLLGRNQVTMGWKSQTRKRGPHAADGQFSGANTQWMQQQPQETSAVQLS